MRIPSKVNAPDRAVRADRTKDAGKSPAKSQSVRSSSSGAAGGVKATVSTRARELAGESSINVKKVNELRELIESGQFVMDFQLIAERIVSTGG
jgi:flagellar biosynthesis anti-sigma factor FlgM